MRRLASIALLLAALSLAGCAASYRLTVAYSRERDTITGRWGKEQIGGALTIEPKKETMP